MNSSSNNLPSSRGSELARDSAHSARGYSALRLHRWSATGFAYFLTFCTQNRQAGLVTPELLAAFAQERTAMEADLAWLVRAWIIMPDHVHILCELGTRLSLGRTVARFKGKSAPCLHAANLRWQPGYFEHRLRDPDEIRPTLHYLLMNPVRAQLARHGDLWPGFHCCADDWAWFKEYADEAVVEPFWLESADERYFVASKLAPTARNLPP
jgi:REP element-mobilizing transposase RayT